MSKKQDELPVPVERPCAFCSRSFDMVAEHSNTYGLLGYQPGVVPLPGLESIMVICQECASAIRALSTLRTELVEEQRKGRKMDGARESALYMAIRAIKLDGTVQLTEPASI